METLKQILEKECYPKENFHDYHKELITKDDAIQCVKEWLQQQPTFLISFEHGKPPVPFLNREKLLEDLEK
jgi:hypothetical protein